MKVRPVKPDVSDADAAVADVVSLKTFYSVTKSSYPPKKTGTLTISDTAAVGDVRSGETFHNEPYTQRTGTADLSEHANNEATDVGASTTPVTAYYDTFADGNTVISQSVNTTARCCIVVVTTFSTSASNKSTDIQRGGVNKTTETTISAANYGFLAGRGHLQYATEVLNAGTYTYNLVNTSGGDLLVAGSTLKIVAVTF